MVGEQDGIERLNELRTMHLGPDDVLSNLSVDFAGDLSADQVEAAIAAMERRIKADYPEIRRVFIETQSRQAHRRDQARAGQAGR